MTASIIIVNYNVKYFVEQCLHSVAAAIKDLDAEVMVVDNCSADDSISYLQPRFDWVHFICNKQNKGFSKANNQALLLAKGKYILFLNPDTIVPENGIKDCIDFFEKNENAGAAGVQMINGHGRFLAESKRSFPSPVTSFFKLFGLSFLFPSSKFFGRYALGFLDKNQVHVVEVLSGAFMMVRKEALEKTGGFDEDYFMYGEDIDLSYRMLKKGYKNYYLGTISIIHFKGESTRKGSFFYNRMFYNAMRLFVEKHIPGNCFIAVFLKMAISVRAFLSLLFIPVQGLHRFVFKCRKKKPRRIVFIGDPADIRRSCAAIQDNCLPVHFLHPQQIAGAQLNKGDEIIFCTGTFTYGQAIDLLKKIQMPVKWMR